MATPFSWSDTIQITFGSCLPCLKPAVSLGEDAAQQQNENNNPAINRIPRARPDELQGLLADPDTDVEAETMSLHSNPGRSSQRDRNKKKRRSKKVPNNPRKITLFGYDLFGRGGAPPIQLPDDDDALHNDSQPRQRRTRNGSLTPNTIVTTHSTASTFDSDAAPLDADAIDAMSSPSAAAAQAAEAEAQRLREKEERRQRRREKKELKRLAEALARRDVVGDGDGEGFEGFQGSGAQSSGYPRFPGQPTSDSGSGSGLSGSTREGFGGFVSAPPAQFPPENDDDDDAADLDGGMYARKAPRGPAAGGGGGSNGSDSRSRTSASRSSDKAHQFPDPRQVFAHIQSHSFSQSSSRVNSPSQLQFGINATKEKFKSKSASSRTTRSRSSAGTSQSPSIPSPVSPAFVAGVQEIVSPSTVEQGQGFFDLEDERPFRKSSLPTNDVPKSPSTFPSTRIGGGGGFPSTGFGGGGATRTRDFGAFLAHRGGDEDAADGL